MTDTDAEDGTEQGAAREEATVEIRLNGEAFELGAGSTVLDLLQRLGRHPRTVAVEHNGDIVPRERYGEVELRAGDRVEVVHFVQGG
jgi:thiamine biosynthesis protein ThiS